MPPCVRARACAVWAHVACACEGFWRTLRVPLVDSPRRCCCCLPFTAGNLPRVYFTVLHRDGWGRETVQGYGQLSLTPQAGSRIEVVKTWLPEGDVSQRMQEWFIGGALQLRDVALAGAPPDLKVRDWR